MPTTPPRSEGLRTEPPVSPPSEKNDRFPPVEAPEPPLLPPVRNWLYAALAGRVTVVDTTTTYRRRDPSSGRIEGTIDLDEDDYRPR